MSSLGWLDHPEGAHYKPCGFHWRGSMVGPSCPPTPQIQILWSMTWGPLPQITAFERNPSVDEKETRTLDSCGGKCHSKLTKALTNHLMTVVEHAVAGNAYNEPREDVGEEEGEECLAAINCLSHVSVGPQKLVPVSCRPRTNERVPNSLPHLAAYDLMGEDADHRRSCAGVHRSDVVRL